MPQRFPFAAPAVPAQAKHSALSTQHSGLAMPIRTDRNEKTFIITLDRPEAMNSIDSGMFEQLGAAWD